MTRPPRFNLSPLMRALAAKARKPTKPRKAQRAEYAARMLERASVNLRKAGGLLEGTDGKTPPNPPGGSAAPPAPTDGTTHDDHESPNP